MALDAGFPPAVHGAAEDELAPKALRRILREARRARRTKGLADQLGDAYTAVFALALSAAILINLVHTVEGQAPVAAAAIPAPAAAMCVLLLGVAAGLGLCARLGPLTLGAPQLRWWLPLPAERSGMVRPVLQARVLVAVLLGAFTVLVIGATAQPVAAGGLLRAALLGAAVGVLLVAVATAAQARGVRWPLVRATNALCLLAVAALVAGSAKPVGQALGATLPVLLGSWWYAAAGVVLAVVAVAFAHRRTREVRGIELREASAQAGYAAGAALSLDTRELARALTAGPRPRRRRSQTFGWVRGPHAAIVAADVTLLRRQPARLASALVLAAAPAVSALVAGPSSRWWQLGAVVVGGYLAATTLAEAARQELLVPAAARLLPLPAADVPRLRVAVPAGLMVVWMVVGLSLLGAVRGLPAATIAGWALVGLLAGPAIALAAVRGATRAQVDLAAPALDMGMGAIPIGAVGGLLRGPDAAALLCLPLAAVVLGATPTGTVALLQLTLSAIGLALAPTVARAPRPRRS